MSIFNNWMFYLILGLSASTLAFGYLSYKFYGDKVEAEYSLVQVIDANTELQKSLNLRDLSCKIDDEVVSEYQTEKKVQQDKVQDAVSKIDSLPKKPLQVTSNEINDINIDSKLPVDLVEILNNSFCSGNKSQDVTCPDQTSP
jgi:hypothetical protein